MSALEFRPSRSLTTEPLFFLNHDSILFKMIFMSLIVLSLHFYFIFLGVVSLPWGKILGFIARMPVLRIQRATGMGIVICARYYSMIWTEYLSSELSDVGTASFHYFFS